MPRPVLLGVLAVGSLLSFAQEKTPSQYAKMVAQVKAGAVLVDFKQMRPAYMDSPEFQAARDTDAQAEAMIEAINANDFPAAIKNADVSPCQRLRGPRRPFRRIRRVS